MRIALDLRPLQVGHENRGIGNYLVNILQYFPKDSIEYIFIRYSKSNPLKDLNIPLEHANYKEIVIVEKKFSKKPLKLLKFIIGLCEPISLKVIIRQPDVYIQPDFLFGFPRAFWIKKVVISYDLIPLLFKNMYIPHWSRFAGQRQRRFRNRVRLSLRAYYHSRRYEKGIKTLQRADKIVSISQTTTNDIIRFAHVKPDKIKTIYLAPSFSKITTKPDRLSSMEEIKKMDKRYLFFIGGTDARREVHEIVFAHNMLNARGINFDLVLAGNEFVPNSSEISTTTKNAIEASSYKDKIHLLGKIDEHEKHTVFQHAFAFVFPTLYEGFGLPILEAMQCETPVITYANPATKEIAGNAALYTDENNGHGIYNSVISLLEDKKKITKLTKLGLKRVNDFGWDKTGKETIDYIFKN